MDCFINWKEKLVVNDMLDFALNSKTNVILNHDSELMVEISETFKSILHIQRSYRRIGKSLTETIDWAPYLWYRRVFILEC